MKVSDIMTPGAASVRPEASLADAAGMMIDFAISALPVIDQDEKLVGILTERDIFKDERSDILKLNAAQRASLINQTYLTAVATPDSVTIASDASAEEAARKMAEFAIRRLPVVDEGKVVGIISRADLLCALTDKP
jgi:CBS domain-containing protein